MATPTTLPASFTDGTALPASSLNAIRGAFRILQVVSGSTSTIVANSTTTLADTGLTATITPQSTDSKILVIVSQTYGKSSGNASNAVISVLKRGTTTVSTFQGAALYTGTTVDFVGSAASAVLLDSPATVSAVVYKTQFCNFTGAASVSANTNSALGTITLMEVSA
jgi:hypothetical protein